MSGSRHRARVIALQALYEIDLVGHDSETTLAHGIQEDTSEDIAGFARKLVAGVLQRRQEIDRAIQRFAPTYPVEQLSPIDRNTLRLAISEIMFTNGVPIKAAINEAVELAKTFGSEASPRFINGVLGAVVNAGVPGRGSKNDSDTAQIKGERR
jgi:N utilization substance protein B